MSLASHNNDCVILKVNTRKEIDSASEENIQNLPASQILPQESAMPKFKAPSETACMPTCPVGDKTVPAKHILVHNLSETCSANIDSIALIISIIYLQSITINVVEYLKRVQK